MGRGAAVAPGTFGKPRVCYDRTEILSPLALGHGLSFIHPPFYKSLRKEAGLAKGRQPPCPRPGLLATQRLLARPPPLTPSEPA